MNHDYIPIDIDSMPYEQVIDLADKQYTFKFYRNEFANTFYVDISDADGNLIQPSEPIILNQPLWRGINNEDLPIETIIPMDESNIATEVTEDNLGKTVQLCIDDMGSDDND